MRTPSTPDSQTATYKGNFNININGTTFNKLKSDVYEMENGVTFYADNNRGGKFQVAIPNIPAMGTSVTVSLDSDDDATKVLLALEPIEGYVTLIGGSETVTRESADKYTLNVVLYGGSEFTDQFPMSGTISVGSHEK